MLTYYVTSTRATQMEKMLAFKDEANTINIDCSAWAEDNGTVTSVVITVEKGEASVSNESLTANISSFLLTTAERGSSLLKIKITDGTNIIVLYLYVWVKEPFANIHDYGLHL